MSTSIEEGAEGGAAGPAGVGGVITGGAEAGGWTGVVRPEEPMETVLPWREGGRREGPVGDRPVSPDQADSKAAVPFAKAAATLEVEV